MTLGREAEGNGSVVLAPPIRSPRRKATGVTGGVITPLTHPVLDDGRKRVQILDGETAATIPGGNGEGPAAHQFSGSFGGMALADSGVVYICDWKQHRVQRWQPSEQEATTMAG